MLGIYPPKLNHDSEPISDQISDLRGRSHSGPRSARFRYYVQVHVIDVHETPALFPIALRRSEKVRGLIQAYYPIGSTTLDLRAWATEACRVLDEILPALNPPKFPTHFLLAGVTIDGKDEPFFKAFLSIANGRRSPDDCARDIGAFIFHRVERHIAIVPADLFQPQFWVLNCLLVQWQLLRRV